jgi:hypothetical protein
MSFGMCFLKLSELFLVRKASSCLAPLSVFPTVEASPSHVSADDMNPLRDYLKTVKSGGAAALRDLNQAG